MRKIARIHFFLLLNNTPLCDCITFYLFISFGIIGFFPFFGYYEYCCFVYSCIHLCVAGVCVCAQSSLVLCDPKDWHPHPWNSLGKDAGMGCHFLLQGIFPTQVLKQRFSCISCTDRQILYHCATPEAHFCVDICFNFSLYM